MGISFRSIVIHTLNPELCFAELPGTSFWIPMISSGEETYIRLRAPFRTVDAPRTGFGRDVLGRRGEKREEITIIFKGIDTLMSALAVYPIPNGNCPYHVLLTFPPGFNQHSIRRVYAAQSMKALRVISPLGLTVEQGLPEHAFGAVEFASEDSRTTLFFVFRIVKDGEWPRPWRCKGESKMERGAPNLYTDELSIRARAYALEVSQDKKLSPGRRFGDTMHSANIEPPSKKYSRGQINLTYQLHLLDVPRRHSRRITWVHRSPPEITPSSPLLKYGYQSSKPDK